MRWKDEVISNKNLTKQNEIKDFFVSENLVTRKLVIVKKCGLATHFINPHRLLLRKIHLPELRVRLRLCNVVTDAHIGHRDDVGIIPYETPLSTVVRCGDFDVPQVHFTENSYKNPSYDLLARGIILFILISVLNRSKTVHLFKSSVKMLNAWVACTFCNLFNGHIGCCKKLFGFLHSYLFNIIAEGHT